MGTIYILQIFHIVLMRFVQVVEQLRNSFGFAIFIPRQAVSVAKVASGIGIETGPET